MAENIVQSLFGFTPQAVQEQMYQAGENRAMRLAQMSRSPTAAAEFYGLRAAERVGAAPIFGPSQQVQRAGSLQSIIQGVQASGVDLSQPEGLIELANAVGQNPEFGGIATSLRQEAAKMTQQSALTSAKIFKETALGVKALQEKPESKVLPPGSVMVGPTGEIIARGEPVTPKGEQPSESKRKYDELVALGVAPDRAREIAYRIKAEGEEERPGFIGRTGAFRNQFGEVIPASEMSKQRTGFQAAEDLLNNLNKITSTDIRNAEAKIDYTQGEARKAVAGTLFKKTLDAQTKIAASQLLQQIESLPPGSASDADMRASARSFPGYSDSTALLNWVNRTKETLEQSLARQNEQYGFNRRIRSSAPLSFGQQQGRTRGSNQPPQGVTQQEWDVMTPADKELFK